MSRIDGVYTYIDIKNEKVYTNINGYVYSLQLNSDWVHTISELMDGGYRNSKPDVNILGISVDFEHIVNRLKRGK